MKICIFGSRGFIGQSIVRYGNALNVSEKRKVQFVEFNKFCSGQFDNEADCEGAHLFINCIGKTPSNSQIPWRNFYLSNVIIPKRIGELARLYGVSQVVHFSTCAVSENSVLASKEASSHAFYKRSKLMGEKILIKQSSKSLNTLIVRLPLVYGLGVKGRFVDLLKIFSYSLPLPIKGYGERGSYLSLENLHSFLRLFFVSRVACDGILELSDRCDLSLSEWAVEVRDFLGKKQSGHFNFPSGINRLLENFEPFAQLSKYVYSPYKVTCVRAESELCWRAQSSGINDRRILYESIFNR